MSKFRVTIHVFHKPDVLNPEESPTREGLHRLGFSTVSNLKKGKCIIVELDAIDRDDAQTQTKKMCVDGTSFFLVNPVVEIFKVVDTEPVL